MSAVLALVGPTASGKSGVAEEVAQRRGDVEVVAVDAFTVYRGMDIGTAKPSPEVRAAVRHHMIDILEPEDDVSVQWFQEHARAAIADIHARDRIPLLVGGSGLYFRAVVDRLRFPPTDPDVRSRLEAEHDSDAAAAHATLAAADPVAAAAIDPNNLRRIVRALEVIELTGEPFSSFREAWDNWHSVYDLHPVQLDVPDLDARIDERTATMLAAGLLDEAAALRQRALSRTARQAIGYAEAFAVLEGVAGHDGLHAAISRRTRRYARRQRSWFARDPRLHPVGTHEAVRRLCVC
ncbi:MAG: tRNA (adenosine(37)-N6)-dimethylallyltransferase MiaA [Nitriliruptorales bacterium]|nr:tRNA (adenosine(37)-N6)-dimethylallyltransferase MiaA [Nitriliruptorales bacterium]